MKANHRFDGLFDAIMDYEEAGELPDIEQDLEHDGQHRRSQLFPIEVFISDSFLGDHVLVNCEVGDATGVYKANKAEGHEAVGRSLAQVLKCIYLD